MTLDGWTLRQVRLDEQHEDEHGWRWGPGERLWHLTDGIDSLTVRAPCPVIAMAVILEKASWPPRVVRRLNWEYQA